MSEDLALKHSIQLEKLQRRVKNLEEQMKNVKLVTDDVTKFCDMVEEEDKQYSKLRRKE